MAAKMYSVIAARAFQAEQKLLSQEDLDPQDWSALFAVTIAEEIKDASASDRQAIVADLQKVVRAIESQTKTLTAQTYPNGYYPPRENPSPSLVESFKAAPIHQKAIVGSASTVSTLAVIWGVVEFIRSLLPPN